MRVQSISTEKVEKLLSDWYDIKKVWIKWYGRDIPFILNLRETKCLQSNPFYFRIMQDFVKTGITNLDTLPFLLEEVARCGEIERWSYYIIPPKSKEKNTTHHYWYDFADVAQW